MSDTLEQELRAALTEHAANLSPEAVERLARIDFRAQSRRLPGRSRFWPGLAGVGGALIAGIIAAVVLFSSSAPVAYAGWTPTPTTPTPAALAAATAACNRAPGLEGLPVRARRPVLTDARGRYTAELYVVGDDVVWDCISDGRSGDTNVGAGDLQIYKAPRADQLGLPGGGGGSAPGFRESTDPNQPLPPQFQAALQHIRDPTLRAEREAGLRRMLILGVETHVYGLAGSRIAAATFAFANGVTVDATVQKGWYFAWWPGLDYPTSVQITTRAGATITSQMPGPSCPPGSSTCIFAGVRLPTTP